MMVTSVGHLLVAYTLAKAMARTTVINIGTK